MYIKIIKGNYGYNDGRIVRAKSPSDPPFEVPSAEADRLCALGVAQKVTVNGAPFAENSSYIETDAASAGKSDDDTINEDGEKDADSVPEYNEDSSNAELQAIAKEYGIAVPNRANKAELISALDERFGSAPTLRS